jgi:hypothetical protein
MCRPSPSQAACRTHFSIACVIWLEEDWSSFFFAPFVPFVAYVVPMLSGPLPPKNRSFLHPQNPSSWKLGRVFRALDLPGLPGLGCHHSRASASRKIVHLMAMMVGVFGSRMSRNRPKGTKLRNAGHNPGGRPRLTPRAHQGYDYPYNFLTFVIRLGLAPFTGRRFVTRPAGRTLPHL